MTYFDNDFIQFFKDLSANNEKEWFHSNKKRYENTIKKPFNTFLSDLISEIQKHDSSIKVEPKDCLGRINRDIRFSKDKTPYNLHYTAFVSSAGKKDKSIPGIYLRFTAEDIGIMAGSFGPEKEQLQQIRNYIQDHLDEFQGLYKDKTFGSTFGQITGDANKRIPAEFQSTFETEPLIANKQFYYVAKEKPALITSNNLVQKIMEYWHVAQPLNDFFHKALKS